MTDHGMDSYYKELTDDEHVTFEFALQEIIDEAIANAHKRPKMTTLLEEFSELVLALRGKHKDTPREEITQVASVAINLLWQLMHYGPDSINNIVTIKKEE